MSDFEPCRCSKGWSLSSLIVINKQLDNELNPKTSTRGVISRILRIALVRQIRSKDRVLNKAVFKHIYLSIILLFAITDYPGRFYMYSYIVNCQFHDEDFHRSPSYGVYISQLICFA